MGTAKAYAVEYDERQQMVTVTLVSGNKVHYAYDWLDELERKHLLFNN